jgi:hypothetical protein
MPRNPTTGIFVRVANSFSNPVLGEIIDPIDANALFNDYDLGLTNAVPEEPTVVTGASAIVAAGTGAIAIQRAAPSATGLTLPAVADQDGTPLHIVDWSTSVVDHTITLTPAVGETIMQQSTLALFSSSTQNGSITLYPSTVLDGWYL